MAMVADQLRQSQQPLVPSQLINFGGGGDGRPERACWARLLSLLTAEKLGIEVQPKKLAAAATPVAATAPAVAVQVPWPAKPGGAAS